MTARRSLVFVGLALLPACCGDDVAPEYTKPLAKWRETGVAARSLPTTGGPTLQVPASQANLCVDPSPSNSYSGCSFDLDETSGRLATQSTGYDQRLDVEMVFERGRFAQLRNEARIGADQRAAGDPPNGQAAVEQVQTGISGGQAFAVGCWHRLGTNSAGTGLDMNGPYGCTLVIENRSVGATVVDYPAAAPPRPGAPIDRARLDGIVTLVATIETSFLPPG